MKSLAPAEDVADRAGECLGDGGSGLRGAFDPADGGHGRAQNARHQNRQETVDQLRGGVHEQRHETERPDAAGQRTAADGWRVLSHAGNLSDGSGTRKAERR